MGCTLSCNRSYVPNETQSEVQKEDPAPQIKIQLPPSPYSYPAPFGHLPYNPALPGAMGPLWSYPMEWWYYGGWAQSVLQPANQPGPKFTLFLQTIRITTDSTHTSSLTDAVIAYGVGMSASASSQPTFFLKNQSSATGFNSEKSPGQQGLTITPTTQDQWYCGANTDSMQMTCELISGVLGLAGASYKLEIADNSTGFNAIFNMHDPFGAIMELASGVETNPSYEYALPCLNITSGRITLNGVNYQLVDGNLWLDRQTYAPTSGSTSRKLNSKHIPLRHQPVEGQQLYTGNWLAIVMNDKTVYVLVFFWNPKKDQWIVGDKLNPAIPPHFKTGLKFPYSSQWMDWKGIPPMNGVSVLEQTEFDLNIFDPSNPSQSPHWTSPNTGHTYCTKWQMQIGDKQYVMTALVPESEVTVGPQSFFEGAAIISDYNDPSGQPLGYAMVEQMGYTH